MSGGHEEELVVANQAYSEPEERWGGLHGPAAVESRLRDIEMRLGQLRGELGEVGRWALHPSVQTSAGPSNGSAKFSRTRSERSARHGKDDCTISRGIGF